MLGIREMLFKHHLLNGSSTKSMGRNTDGSAVISKPRPCWQSGWSLAAAGTHQLAPWLHDKAHGTAATVRGRQLKPENRTSNFCENFK